MSTIRIDPAYVEQLELHCRGIASALDEISCSMTGLGRAPEVEEALDTFQGRWSANRADIEAGLVSLADVFRVVHENLQEVDQSLATSLGDGVSGGGGGSW